MISFSCSACGERLKVKDELAGKKGKCPKCKNAVVVPGTAPIAGPADAVTLPPTPAVGALAPDDVATLAPSAPSHLGRNTDTHVPDAHAPPDDRNHLTDFLAPPQSRDELGRLGPYRVLKILGHGGMGVVFKAEDPGLKRQVALKAMLPSLAASDSNRKRFLREAQAAAAIEHDNIVHIYQVAEDRGVPFMAMQFLKGEPLDDRLRKEPRLPLSDVLSIGRETAQGLAAAQERGLIHRDIKPANLWLETQPAAGFRVKILDFGLARGTADDSHLTQQGAIIGTPAYMAPEQVEGKKVDGRADLFSLGVVLYRLCTGELPFKGTDTVSTLMAVAMVQPKAPKALNPKVPSALSTLVMQLLAKIADERPQTAQQVVATLREIEKGASAETLASKPQVAAAFEDEDETLTGDRDKKPKRKKSGKKALPAPLWLAIGGAAAVIVVISAVLLMRPARPTGEKELVAVNDAKPANNDGKTKSSDSGTAKQVADNDFLEPDANPAPLPEKGSAPTPQEAAQSREMALAILKLPGCYVGIEDKFGVPQTGMMTNILENIEKRGPFFLTQIQLARSITDESLKMFEGKKFPTVWMLDLFGTSVQGPGLRYVRASMPYLRQMNFGDSPITDAGLKEVAAFKGMTHLILRNTRVTDRGMHALKRLPRLQTLDLQKTEVTSAGFEPLAGLADVLMLFAPPKFDDAGMRFLESMRRLTVLDLAKSKVTDAGLAHLDNARELRQLNLYETAITDVGLDAIKDHRNLYQLALDDTKITDAGLGKLSGLRVLRVLSLSMTKITDKGLEGIKDLQLEQLMLMRTKVGDDGLAHLKKMKMLHMLNLTGTKVTGAGMRHLKELPNLQQIILTDTDVDDASLEHLKGLKNLEHLWMMNSKVTPEGVKKFKQQMPRLQSVFPNPAP